MSGCTTTVVKPVQLPHSFQPSRESVDWLVENDAPEHVINDFVDCTAQGEIIEITKEEKPEKTESWDIGTILTTGWTALTSWW